MNSQGPVYISEGFDSTEPGERKELGSDDPRVNVPSLVASFVMNPPRGSFITPTQDYYRTLLAIAGKYTCESLMLADERVRSREEAQGPSLIWYLDQNTQLSCLQLYPKMEPRNMRGGGRQCETKGD